MLPTTLWVGSLFGMLDRCHGFTCIHTIPWDEDVYLPIHAFGWFLNGLNVSKYITYHGCYGRINPEEKACVCSYKTNFKKENLTHFENCELWDEVIWCSHNPTQLLNMMSKPKHLGVSKNNGTPKSSILVGISIINHPFWGTPIFGNIHLLYIIHHPWSSNTTSALWHQFSTSKDLILLHDPRHFGWGDSVRQTRVNIYLLITVHPRKQNRLYPFKNGGFLHKNRLF